MHQSIARPASATLFIALTSFVLASGCGQPGDSGPPAANISAGQKTPQSSSAQSSSAGTASPQAAVVRQFLQAIQQGDQAAARSLLTAKTVEAFDQYDVPFLPSAIESGQFQIGQTVQSGSTYFVQCIWLDQDSSGQAQGEKIQWMVKQDGGGAWRIYGLAVYVEEAGENRVINFEKPHELVQGPPVDRQAVDGQAAQETSGQAAPPQQATLPQDPFQSAPR